MNASFGFLMFFVGRDVERQRACFKLAYPDVPFVAHHGLTSCAFSQHGNSTGRRCWNRLMREKVTAILGSPFSMSIVVDTDVWPNPHHKWRHTLGEKVNLLLQQYTLAGVLDTWSTTISFGFLNGGFLVVQKTDESETFFRHVIAFLDRDRFATEQMAYNTLLKEPQHSGLRVRVLHHMWSCTVHHVWEQTCLFIHSHRVNSCPDTPYGIRLQPITRWQPGEGEKEFG